MNKAFRPFASSFMPEILPSILSADFARLGEQVAAVEKAGCRMLHVDVMDGHFVPNLTIGPPVVASLHKATRLTLDVHLMITDPDRYAPLFIEAGADQISVHQEACPHLDRTLKMIQGLGVRAGVVLNPATPLATLDQVLEFVDFVLIMSVNPGFGGQKLIPYTLEKVRRLAAQKRERGLKFAIEIDGGVTLGNVAEVVKAGVDWVVAGSAIFGAGDPAGAFAEMRQLAHAAGMVHV
jgi:ribulose-phosphate 3-epimerase